MAAPIRLDKYLADMGIGTRSEVKNYIRKGRIQVNHVIIKEPDYKVDISSSEVSFDNQAIAYETYEYFMLNKPVGVVSATRDNHDKTVVELIRDSKVKELFPVGRLDKDTEGLLLITNDGELAHQLLSPKKHVPKVYYAKIKGRVTEAEIQKFAAGIDLKDFVTKPSRLLIHESGEISYVEITIYEGKFHQVKRMFEAVGKEVIYLKRLSMGDLKLDDTLKTGEYRKLTVSEINKLKGND